MLFLLFGSSAGGKTFVLDELRRRGLDMAIHDFDEIGVPPEADRAWRHRSNEAELGDYLAWAEWLRRHAVDPRWRVSTVDTSGVPVERVADAVVEWIETERLRAVSLAPEP